MATESSHALLAPTFCLYEVGLARYVKRASLSPTYCTSSTLGQSNTTTLIVVVGALHDPAVQEHAVQIAAKHQDADLRVALYGLEDGVLHAESALNGVSSAFDTVFKVTHKRRQQFIDRLLRTVGLRDAHEQHIACDWDAVCQLAKASRGQPTCYGFGRGVGLERATVATTAAIEEVEAEGIKLGLARGLCVGIYASSKELLGNEIKDVLRQLRLRLHRAATVTLSIGYDTALPPDSVEVNIFAFGELDATELLREYEQQTASLIAGLPPAWEGVDPRQDPLYLHARSLVLAQGRASISLVQRHLRIGYGRAARLLEAMEGF